MTLPRIVGISGNLRRPSRTRTLIEAVAMKVARTQKIAFSIYDVLDAGSGLGIALRRDELTAEAEYLVQAIERADALIVGTPVYKGSYTGLFKHLFDFVDPKALENTPVVLTATGGGLRHALVVEHQLRPLFGFFSALVVPTTVYASDLDFTDGKLVNEEVAVRVEGAAQQLAGIIQTSFARNLSPTLLATAG
jgi:FMN reductase